MDFEDNFKSFKKILKSINVNNYFVSAILLFFVFREGWLSPQENYYLFILYIAVLFWNIIF